MPSATSDTERGLRRSNKNSAASNSGKPRMSPHLIAVNELLRGAVQHPIERPAVDSQDSRRFRLVAAAAFEDAPHVETFEFVQAHGVVRPVQKRIDRVRSLREIEIGWQERVVIAQRHGAFDEIA